MITLEKENCNCRIARQNEIAEKLEKKQEEVNNEVLCKSLCVNILEGLLEAYSDLRERKPDKKEEFQSKIEEIKKQLHYNDITEEIEESEKVLASV